MEIKEYKDKGIVLLRRGQKGIIHAVFSRFGQSLGIQCKVFAPVSPFVSTCYNYRDHRKILVIDGHTAFNGGVNLADEYINQKVKFGHWKDAAVMLKGDGVKSFTLILKSRRNYNNSLIRLAGQAQMLHKLSAVPLIPDTVYACH